MASDTKKLSILFVLESAPELSSSLAFFNSYIDALIASLTDEVQLCIYYPEINENEELYSLNIVPGSGFTRFITYIPSRYISYRDSFSNPEMENVFEYILKEHSFDCIHFWSLKNHSLTYPLIAKERGLFTVTSVTDGFLFSNSIFSKGISPQEEEKVRISNFVDSPVSVLFKKASKLFSSDRKKSAWFENVGRFSSYYNRTTMNSVERSTMRERTEMADDVLNFSDRIMFFSEVEYNLFYRTLIPEDKVLFVEQGILCDGTFENRPFEIEGAVKFGFMGELISEDGILETVKAFNSLYDDGFMNEIHVYGELFENSPYFSRLNKKVRNPNTYFHGPIEPGRINAALNTFDVLILPSKWHRSDTYLLNSAVTSRKAVICSSRNVVAEKVRKFARGLILDDITPESIYNAVSELERNRKRLYYFMRVTADYKTPEIRDNMKTLLNCYSRFRTGDKEETRLLLQKKINRRKAERHRG